MSPADFNFRVVPAFLLLGMLRQIADYLQINCNNDMATLLSSGLEAADVNEIRATLV